MSDFCLFSCALRCMHTFATEKLKVAKSSNLVNVQGKGKRRFV